MKHVARSTKFHTESLVQLAKNAMERKMLEMGFSNNNSELKRHLIGNALSPITLTIERNSGEKDIHKIIKDSPDNNMVYLHDKREYGGRIVTFAQAMEIAFAQNPLKTITDLKMMGFEKDFVEACTEIINSLKKIAIKTIEDKGSSTTELAR